MQLTDQVVVQMAQIHKRDRGSTFAPPSRIHKIITLGNSMGILILTGFFTLGGLKIYADRLRYRTAVVI
jgi:hypothetical protein